jgi:hypothetical protein
VLEVNRRMGISDHAFYRLEARVVNGVQTTLFQIVRSPRLACGLGKKLLRADARKEPYGYRLPIFVVDVTGTSRETT